MIAIVVNIYLLWGTVQDLKKKKITNYYLWMGVVLGVIVRNIDYGNKPIMYREWLIAFIPGIFLLILVKITEEKIGEGDAWLVIILGNFMTFVEISLLLQSAIILSALFSIIALCGKKASKTHQIPFLPFLWISHLFMWGLGYV